MSEVAERVLPAEAVTSQVPSLLSAGQQAAWMGMPLSWVGTPPGAWRSTFEIPTTSVVLLDSGRITTSIRTRGRTHDVEFRPGKMALFTGGTELKVNQAGCANARRIILGLEPACVTGTAFVDDDLLDGMLLQPSAEFDDEPLAAMLRAMLREVLDGSPNGALFAQSLSLGVLLHTKRTRGMKPGGAAERGKLSPAQWKRVAELIEARLGDDLALPTLADAAGLSRAQFVRLFRNVTGTSPHRYVMRRRVERAKELLVHSDLPLAAIAADMGFASQSHLNQMFRSFFGVTPGDLRRQSGRTAGR